MSENEIKPVAWTSECQLSAVRIQGDGIMMAKGRGWGIGLYDQSAIDALTKQIGELKTMLSIAEFQRKEMQSERDAAVADAERYRFLRNAPIEFPAQGVEVAAWDDGYGEAIRGDALDAAIDAARAKEGQG